MQGATRTIIHADLNSFFAMAEQQTNPRLRGKPIGIIKAKGRACIIAASVEAKKQGVVTGTNVFEAKKLCPQIILIPANFSKYEDFSLQFINICKRYSYLCEVFSLDECFIDVTETEKFFGGVLTLAYDIKKRLSAVGDYMTCSVGISHNRLLAKLASEQIKPDGLFLITEANVFSVLDKSQLTDVCGLGWALEKRLLALGIDSFPKLRGKSMEFLHAHFGPVWSVHLYNLCRGIDLTPVCDVSSLADAKSVGRTYTTHRNLYKLDEVFQLVRNLCEETAAKARQMHLSGRYVGFVLRGQDMFYGHRTLKNYINDGKKLFDICVAISKNWNFCNTKDSYVRFCGITLGMLAPVKYNPTPLFPWDIKRNNLVSSLDRINGKYGDYTVFPAQLLGMQIIRPEVNGYFGDKVYRLKKLQNTNI